ncbi:MAG: hypothetical protein ACI8WM_003359, partial [Burkholderiaceae bacterium]
TAWRIARSDTLLQMQTIILYLVNYDEKVVRYEPGSAQPSILRTILV